MFGPNAACRDAPVSYQGISFRIRASLSRCRQIPESDAPLGAAHGRAKYFYIFFRQHAGFHLRIGHDVRGLASCPLLADLRGTQFIPEADYFLSHMFQIRENNNLVIIVYGSLIAAAGIDHGDEAVVFALHILIAEAKLAEEFHPSHFKPYEMISVIDDPHLIGFSIADADTRLIHRRRIFYPGRHRCIAPLHRPVHFGLRFSRNDSIPSRKSSLSRMPAFSRMAASICASSSSRACSVSRRLVLESESGLFSANCAASSRARSSNLSAGTISLIRPIFKASGASNIRPVCRRSRALFSPTWRRRKVETMAGTNPIRTSV